MITKDDINNALNVFNHYADQITALRVEESEELEKALDTIQMAAQAYANIGADNYKERAKVDNNTHFILGYSQAREDVERLVWLQGVYFPKTDADFSDLEILTIHIKKGEPLIFRRFTQ